MPNIIYQSSVTGKAGNLEGPGWVLTEPLTINISVRVDYPKRIRGLCIIKLITAVINYITYKASVFVKASKK
jgi:hypothetical protein